MKLLFICYGHFDSGLELYSELSKVTDATLVVQVEGDKLVQSIFNLDIRDIPLGFHYKDLSTFNLVKEIEKLFNIPYERICLLKYNSLSFRDIKNFLISRKFVSWIKKEGYTHVHYYGSSLTWIQQLLFLSGIKRIYTVHDYLPHSGDVKGSGYQYKFYMKLITSLKSNYFLLLSKKMLYEFNTYYKVKENNSRHILFGTFNCYNKFQNIISKEEPHTILFFGRISRYKGIEYLIKATKYLSKEIPEIKTIIGGGGEFYFDITDIKDNPHFEIHNYYITNEKLVELIKRSAVVVCPYTEVTQSGVIMTAYAFNKPVIATDVGSFREYVIDGETGIIVPTKDSKALSDAIKKILLDEKFRKEMIKNIERKKEEEFNWKKAAHYLTNFCQEIK